MIPVVELIRVSTLAQAGEDRAGIPAQRATNLQTAARFGLRMIETVEVIETGSTVATSLEMARVLDLVSEGRAQGIVLAAYDRLFRPDRWSDLAILQVLMDAGAQIYIPSGAIDLQTETGYVQATVNNLLAGLEKRRIIERTTRAREQLRRQGKLASGTAPFGLAYSKTTGWSYTPDIEHVKEIFQLYLSGRERRLGILSERLGFHASYARKMLANPVYSGWLVWKLGDETIRLPLGLPPVVSEGDFAEVQRIIEQRATRVSLCRSVNSGKYLYRGMLFCPCGAQLYGMCGRSHGRPWHFYGCSSMRKLGVTKCPDAQYMTAHILEPGLDRVIQEQLTDHAFVVAAVEAFNRARAAAWREAGPAPEANARRLAELERRRDRILDTFYDGKITRTERDKQLEPLTVQLDALRSFQLPAPPRPDEIDAGDVLGMLSVFAEWEFLQREEKRRTLEALAPAFVVQRYVVQGVHLPLQSTPEPRNTRRLTSPSSPYSRGLYLPLRIRAA